MRAPRRLLAATLAAFALVVAGCGGGNDDDSTQTAGGGDTNKGSLTIAAANFSENTLLANMYKQVLDKAGYKTTVRSLTNRELIEAALEKGDVDIVPEYAATLTEFLNNKVNGANATPVASGDPQKTVAALRKLAAPRGITVLEPSPAADQNAFAVTEAFAAQNNLTTLSDLGGYTGRIVLGGPPECPTRPFCQPGLAKTYGIKFAGFKALDAGGPLTKKALQSGTVQLGLVFTSDGSLQNFKLKILEDDKKLQLADNIVAVVNTKKNSAEIDAALNKVAAALTTEELQEMNKQMDLERARPEKVAEDFLKSKNLI